MIHAIGDSHARIFQYINGMSHLKTKFQVCSVIGATNIGLSNPQSKTRAVHIFNQYLDEKINKGDDLLFMAGEGDCGYVIWSRAERHNTSFEEQMELSLKNYFDLVERFVSKSNGDVIMCDTPYPTLRTGDKNGDVANIRYDIGAKYTQVRRTAMTAQYNERIKSFCKEKGYTHLDYRYDMVNVKTKVIHDRFRNRTRPYDHHCEDSVFAELLVKKLNEIGIE